MSIFCLIVCLVKTFSLNSHEFWVFFHIRKKFHLLSLTTTTRAERKYKYVENPYVTYHLVERCSTGRQNFCVWAASTGHAHTLIQWKIHDYCGSCCAAWCHSFTQRKAEQTPQPSQKPDTMKDGNLNPSGPRREISRLFRLLAKGAHSSSSALLLCICVHGQGMSGSGDFACLQADAELELQFVLPGHLWK